MTGLRLARIICATAGAIVMVVWVLPTLVLTAVVLIASAPLWPLVLLLQLALFARLCRRFRSY